MKYIALLRAINVGGRNVKMAALREQFAALGFSNVETFIASGNVIFNSPATPASLKRAIENRLASSLGFTVDTFIRTPQQIKSIADHPAFAAASIASAGAYCVGFLDAPLDDAQRAILTKMKTDNDNFHLNGSEVYWLCQVKQSDSTFNNAKFERALNIRATFRSINTVAKLGAQCCTP